MTTTPPTAETIKASVQVKVGGTLGSERILCSYTESSSTSGNQAVVLTKELAAGATDQSMDLSTSVDTATIITIKDRGSTGIKVGLAAGGTKFQIASNGVLVYKNGNSTPPTLYFDNVSGTDKAFIEVSVAGSSS